MKTVFTTTIYNLVEDAQKLGSEVLEFAKNNNGFFTVTIEPVKKPGSEEQNRAFHALLTEYWKSGCSSYLSYEDMRDKVKLKTAGAQEYIYLRGTAQTTVKMLDEIPMNARYVVIPKSWKDFTKEQRTYAIDYLISEMTQAGVSSKKFDEIMRGMESA